MSIHVKGESPDLSKVKKWVHISADLNAVPVLPESICKFCKYWELHSETDEYPTHGVCSNPKFIYVGDQDMILNEETGFCEYPKKGDDSFLYRDAECYAANFYTGPNFGCIHHEVKS